MEMIPAMLTLFRTDGALDLAATKTYARFLCDHGATQLLVLGSNGSFPLLDLEERQAVAEAVIEAVDNRVPVLVQVGDPATQRAVHLTRLAKQAGAAGIVAVTPSYYGYDEESLKAYFLEILDAAAPVPTYLYTIPTHARNSISPHLLQALAGQAPHLAGIKDSSTDFQHVVEILATAQTIGRPFSVFIGTEQYLLPALPLGASGGVSGLANVFPELIRALLEAYQSGEIARAQFVHRKILDLEKLFSTFPSLSVHYAALAQRRIAESFPRRPLRPLNASESTRLRKGLQELELLDPFSLQG